MPNIDRTSRHYDYVVKSTDEQPYTIRLPKSGGKAGKDKNATSSVQVLYKNVRVKNIRYNVKDLRSLKAALDKATEYTKLKPWQHETFLSLPRNIQIAAGLGKTNPK